MTAETLVRYEPRGAVRALWLDPAPESLIDGPAGTGKTRGVLELFNLIANNYPHSKQLICRKTLTALTGAALATFRDKVIPEELASGKVEFFGGSKQEPAAFRYPNGSRIVVGGLDNAEKTFSTEYDNAYVNEATELSEDEWELLTRSLRNGVTPHQRLIGDCNPSYDRHWLLKRCQGGQTRRFQSTIRDNPLYWNEARNDYTDEGRRYVEEVLGKMTGTRRQRLYEGVWVGMENAIYPQLDPQKQLASLSQEMLRRPFSWTGRGAGGADYGTVHLSAVVGLSEASDGHIWARKCHAMSGGNLQEIEDSARGIKMVIKTNNGKTDPNQAVLAQRLGWETARMGAGTRKQRIAIVTSWLDADLLRFDADEPEVVALFEECMGYRYETRETDTMIEDVVVRKDDNRVAAMEYAAEAMTTAGRAFAPMVRSLFPGPVRQQTTRRRAAIDAPSPAKHVGSLMS